MLPSGVYEKGQLDFLALLREQLQGGTAPHVGAVVTFTGVTKAVGQEQRSVVALEMQSYEEHANRVIRQICDEVRQKHGVAFVYIYHLLGAFAIGESIVYVVVGAEHRHAAFRALEEAVERYKVEPALWKKEVYADGTQAWVSHA